MDAETVLRIKPTLTRFLQEFEPCMGRVTNRRHLATYVAGQLGDLPRKSIEPMADAAGVPPRTLRRLQEIGVTLKDLHICRWPRK